MILDTTLRDGEQAPGNSMHVYEKLEMAKNLRKLGVNIIEAGFASASPDDFESVKEIADQIQGCTICTLSRCLREDIDLSFEALKNAQNKRIHLFLATSPLHLQYKLQMTEEECLQRIDESVRYAKTLFDDIQFSCEDATRTDIAFLKRATKTAIDAGATVINIPDTVGYTFPNEMYTMIRTLKEAFPETCFSVHCHNDLGMAVANTLAAIEGGVSQIDCTVNGIGERAGNTALEEVVMALKTRAEHYQAETDIVLKQIFPVSQALTAITGIKNAPTKPIVGKNAFMHEAGIHQHGVLANRQTYEIIDPTELGIVKNELVLGKHSGKHALVDYLESLDIKLTDEEVNGLFAEFKDLADKKKKITYKDIMYLLSHRHNVKYTRKYSIYSYSIMTVKGNSAFATVKLNTENGVKAAESIGDGPLDAAFKTINRILGKDFHLLDWQSTAVTEGEDALGMTTLRLACDGKEVTGRGASTDTVEASIMAYVNACNKLV